MKDPKPPTVIIGMHRSGTSVLGRLLEELGFFSGAHKSINDESFFFQTLNNWILRQCGGSWDQPKAITHLLQNDDAMRLMEDRVRKLVKSPRAIHHFGLRYFTLKGGLLTTPWGWKDPRNTLTLPIWLRLYPNAKVIRIERHGADVANSLHHRSSQMALTTNRSVYKKISTLPLTLPNYKLIDSFRCLSLDDCFSLWQEYVDISDRAIENLDQEKTLTIRYENLLLNPKKTLRETAEFCELATNKTSIEKATKNLIPSRAYAHSNDEKLSLLAKKNREILERRGYK